MINQNSQKGFAVPTVIMLVALVVLIGGVSYFITRQQPSIENNAMIKIEEGVMKKVDKDDTMMKVGSYEAYTSGKVALASSTHDVVLFFRASWCPTCRVIDADIKANLSKIPSSLAILDVDYDNSTALKQKYGVTYQHTFVQVDKDGNMIKKWSGSPTLAKLVSEIK